MPTKKKKNAAEGRASASFAGGSPGKPSALLTLILQELMSIQSAADWPNQPSVQAASKLLTTDVTGLGQTLTAIGTTRALLVALEATRETQLAATRRDRRGLLTAIDTVCNGSATAILAWKCLPKGKSASVPSTDAPTNVTALNSTTQGTVALHCDRAKALVAYLYQQCADPAAPAGWGPKVVSGRSRNLVPALAVGQVVYFRMALLRRNGGESKWSDAVQVVVK